MGGQAWPQATDQGEDLQPEAGPGVDEALAAVPQRPQRGRGVVAEEKQRSFAADQQVTDRGRIQPVGLTAPVELGLADRCDRSGVDQAQQEVAAVGEVGGQRLVVVAGGLHPDHHQLRVDPDPCLIQQAAQLTQASAVGRHLGPVDDHAAVQVAAEHKPARLGHVDADQ